MKGSRATGWWVALLLLIAACGRDGRSTGPDDTDVLASAGPHRITVQQFERTYVQRLLASGENDTEVARYRHMDNLIDALLLSKLARQEGRDRTESFQSYSRRQYLSAVGGEYYEAVLLDTVAAPRDDDVRQAYAWSQEQRVARHLFYGRETEARAAYERLEAGISFLEEAKRTYGLAEVDSSAGTLGAVSYLALDDAFAEAAFRTEVGSYSKPVRTRFGWHIIFIDDVYRNPLLTESAYQTRRRGIEERLILRRKRLSGDAFVRAFMAERNVQVRGDAIRAVEAAIKDLEQTPSAQRTEIQTGERTPTVGELRAALRPETVLLDYDDVAGERKSFTAGDYLFWLPELSFQEASANTAASVGRALRNQALAEAGLAADFGDDPEVMRASRFLDALFLSEREREALRAPDSLGGQLNFAREHDAILELRAAYPVEVDTALFKSLAAN